MIRRRRFLTGSAAAAATLAAPALVRAQAAPIKVGEINSYSTAPAFTVPYRNGIALALEQINAGGGLLGRPLEVVHRDDAGRPEDAVRHAGELVNNEHVDLLAGTYLSNIGLAVSDFARQNRKLFVASEPLTDAVVWAQGHRYCYRLRPSTYMQAAMLAEEAVRLPARKWATVAPNYEYGQSAVRWFKALLQARKSDVEFVAEQWPAIGRIDAGATVQALAAASPEAIFNVTFGADLTNFVRQGNTRGLFERRSVVSVLTGEPEYLDPLGEETPEGWIVTGYPWDQLNTPDHTRFRDAYRQKYNDHPRLGSVVGFDTINAIAAAVRRAGAVDTEKLVDAFAGLTFTSPFGAVEFRALDHQSTLGAFVGKLAVANRRGVMTDWRYADGKNYLPSDDEVRRLRPQG
jgi:branched-chain amino acid transport system substrate-binding protein